VEVGLRLQKAYITLDAIADAETKRHVRRHSDLAVKKALEGISIQEDKDII
jgi:hypothetical protein